MDLTVFHQAFSAHKVLSLSYQDSDGVGVCALWYAHDQELNLYFLSSLSTRHGTAIQSGAKVAFAIHKDDQEWNSITGIQGRGEVEMCRDEYAWKIYSSKFPFVREQFTELETALGKTIMWKIRPTWLRYIDNSVRFGYKREIELR